MSFSRRWFLQLVSIASGTALVAAKAPITMPVAPSLPEQETVEAELIEDDPPPAPVRLLRRQTGSTRLESFLRSRGIKPALLARDSGYSRRHLLGVRMGRIASTAHCKAAIVSSLRRLAREPVTVAEIFPSLFASFAHVGGQRWDRRRRFPTPRRLLLFGSRERPWTR